MPERIDIANRAQASTQLVKTEQVGCWTAIGRAIAWLFISPISRLSEKISEIGSSKSKVQDAAPPLNGRLSKSPLTRDPLSTFHKQVARRIVDDVSCMKGREVLRGKGFMSNYAKLPIEIKESFVKYNVKLGTPFPMPIATKGFFAAMSCQDRIHSIVDTAREGNLKSGGVDEVRYLGQAVRDAYSVYCNRLRLSDTPENRVKFFELLLIPEITSEPTEVGPEQDLLKINRAIQEVQSGNTDYLNSTDFKNRLTLETYSAASDVYHYLAFQNGRDNQSEILEILKPIASNLEATVYGDIV